MCETCKLRHYPHNSPNYYYGRDLVRKNCILNNDTTSFVVQDPDPAKVLTRTPALEKIIADSVDTKKERQRTLDTWANPAFVKFVAEEGHNVMVFNKLVKNVIIRWDRDFKKLRQIHGWSGNPKELDEVRALPLVSEIIIHISGEDMLKFSLP